MSFGSPSSPTSPRTPSSFNPGQSPNYSFKRPRAPSPYMRTLLAYVDAVNTRDFSTMDAVFDDRLEHRILPKSMARPVLTKRQYVEYWKGIMELFKEFETKVHEVIEAGDKLTVHGSTQGRSYADTRYSNEYVMMIHFAPMSPDGDGEPPKMLYLKEFVDSSVSLQFFREESAQRKRREEERTKMVYGGGHNGNRNGSWLRGNGNGSSVNGHRSGHGNGVMNGFGR